VAPAKFPCNMTGTAARLNTERRIITRIAGDGARPALRAREAIGDDGNCAPSSGPIDWIRSPRCCADNQGELRSCGTQRRIRVAHCEPLGDCVHQTIQMGSIQAAVRTNLNIFEYLTLLMRPISVHRPGRRAARALGQAALYIRYSCPYDQPSESPRTTPIGES
jgi:hypothetical protein